jgi:hypothetical protein
MEGRDWGKTKITKISAFRSGCTKLQSHQQCIKIPPPPANPCQHLVLFVFLTIGILTKVRWSLSVLLIYMGLMVKDFGHLFMYLSSICTSFENYLLNSFAYL